jgi:hypothetical protein
MSYVVLASFSPVMNGQLAAINILPGDTDLEQITHYTIFSLAARFDGEPTTENLDLALGQLTAVYHDRLDRAETLGLCGLCGHAADSFGYCLNECWVDNPLGHEINMKEDA